MLPAAPIEDPAWGFVEVLLFAFLTLGAIFFSIFPAWMALRWLKHSPVPLQDLIKYPAMLVLAQGLAYVIVLAAIGIFLARPPRPGILAGLRWNWPSHWTRYAIFGIALSIGLQMLLHFLPVPRDLPINRLFHNAREAAVLSAFSVTLAPAFEEVFFRGFLYPVIARRLGMYAGIGLTSVCFALLHAQQLGGSWAPVFAIFLVGVVLTTVRAVSKSLAASFIVHVAYNGTIALAALFVTSFYRHMERLSP